MLLVRQTYFLNCFCGQEQKHKKAEALNTKTTCTPSPSIRQPSRLVTPRMNDSWIKRQKCTLKRSGSIRKYLRTTIYRTAPIPAMLCKYYHPPPKKKESPTRQRKKTKKAQERRWNQMTTTERKKGKKTLKRNRRRKHNNKGKGQEGQQKQ